MSAQSGLNSGTEFSLTCWVHHSWWLGRRRNATENNFLIPIMNRLQQNVSGRYDDGTHFKPLSKSITVALLICITHSLPFICYWHRHTIAMPQLDPEGQWNFPNCLQFLYIGRVFPYISLAVFSKLITSLHFNFPDILHSFKGLPPPHPASNPSLVMLGKLPMKHYFLLFWKLHETVIHVYCFDLRAHSFL